MSEPASADEVRAALGGPDLARLFRQVHEALERRGEQARRVQLKDLSPAEQAALAGLMGLPRLPGTTFSLQLERLDTTLRQSRLGRGLGEVVEILCGPILDRNEEARRIEAALEALWTRASLHPALLQQPVLAHWLLDLRRLNLLARTASWLGQDQGTLLEQALSVVARLPDEDGIGLAILAAEQTGDAHALDPGQPLSALVLRAALYLADWEEMPVTAAERRQLWAEVGVLCDALSSQVLVTGLQPQGSGRLARHLRKSARTGDPCRLTLRELRREPLDLRGSSTIYICENPSIVEALVEGSLNPPLVCVEGVPSTAAWVLLEAARSAGAELRFHCDFDWGGLRIGEALHRRLGAQPWAFSTEDYWEAMKNVRPLPLSGHPGPSSWDPALSRTMADLGHAVHEEQCLSALRDAIATP